MRVAACCDEFCEVVGVVAGEGGGEPIVPECIPVNVAGAR